MDKKFNYFVTLLLVMIVRYTLERCSSVEFVTSLKLFHGSSVFQIMSNYHML